MTRVNSYKWQISQEFQHKLIQIKEEELKEENIKKSQSKTQTKIKKEK